MFTSNIWNVTKRVNKNLSRIRINNQNFKILKAYLHGENSSNNHYERANKELETSKSRNVEKEGQDVNKLTKNEIEWKQANMILNINISGKVK